MAPRLHSRLLFLLSAACSCGPTPPDLPTQKVSSSFVFKEHAFSFENFGGVAFGSAMDEDLMARMFGKQSVCLPSSGDSCQLLPIAKEYRTALNQSLRGGRCEGFAVLSGLIAQGRVDLTPFGGGAAYDLPIEDDRALGQEIAYWFSTQFLRDVVPQSTLVLDAVSALELLHQSFKDAPNAMWRIGLARIDATTGALSGGHAVLAIYVAPAKDEGKYVIGIYDSNHPEAPREMLVTAATDSWSYQASTDADNADTLYSGDLDDGNSLYLAPIEPREGQHPCTFCELDANDEEALAQVFGSASAEIVAVTANGERIGEQDGNLVSEHEDGHALPAFTAACHDCRDHMHMGVPHDPQEGVTLEIRAATHALVEEGVVTPVEASYFGHGFAVTIEGADVDDEELHFLKIGGAGIDATFTSEPVEADNFAVLSLAVHLDNAEQVLVETRAQGSASCEVKIDSILGDPTITIRGELTAAPSALVRVTISEGATLRVFSADVPAPPAGSATIVLAESVQGGEVTALLDNDGDGVVDEQLALPDLGITTDEL